MTAHADLPVHRLDWADIQGNVLRGYRYHVARHCFLRVTDGSRARWLLSETIAEVTTAEDQRHDGGKWSAGDKPHSTLNVAFTHAGLAALSVPQQALDAFAPEFRAGMKARARLLLDRDVSAPEQWDDPWKGDQVHIAVLLMASSQDALEERFESLRRRMMRVGGVELMGTQDAAARFVGGKMEEHFGYLDGFGNPDVAGAPGRTRPGRGKLTENGEWQPIAAGEFLLGQLNEAGEVAPTPQPSGLFRNGTFMVYRKLHQNVATFRRFLRDEGARYQGGPALLAAKIMGRWQDGTPLARSPHHPDPVMAADDGENNRFAFGDDPGGVRCPMGAHIRRANPRDALGFNGVLVNRRRIIRRGIPYGAYTPPGEPGDDRAEHGLIFIAFNASISQQFEFVQQQWMNYGNDFHLGNDKDAVIGSHVERDRLLITGDPAHPDKRPTHLCFGLPTFVQTRGGDYFFMPGISGLRVIAGAPPPPASLV